MRKLNYLLILVSNLFLAAYFVGCREDEIDMTQGTELEFVSEAREYFEQNASDIQIPKVGSVINDKSRQMTLSSNTIVTNWEDAQIKENEYFSTVEVPLSGDVFQDGLFSTRVLNGGYLRRASRVAMKLIVQRSNKTNEFRAFVVTLVGKTSQEDREELSFLATHTLTGLEIISDLEGKYLDSYQFERGEKQRVILARAAGYQEVDSSEVIGRLYLNDMQSAYLYSRSGESGDIDPPIYGGCPLCGSRYCDGSCEVVVRYCRECHQPVSECRCCRSCGRYPCECPPPWTCPKCGSRYCDGDCKQTPGGDVTDPEDPEDPIIVNLSVSVNSTTMTLGNSYQITVNVSPEDAPIERIDLDAINSINQTAGLGNPSNNRTWTIKALRPGKYTIQATAFGDNIQCNTATKDIEVRFPNAEEIKNNSTVRAALDNAWQTTFNSATPLTCCEYGGGIYIKVNDAGECSYIVQQIKGNDYPYQSTDIPITFSVDLGYEGRIDQGGEYLVAAYHTHPLFTKSQGFAKRYVGPSSVDLQNVSTYPCFVYDVVGVLQPGDTIRTHSSSDTSGLTTKIYTYGPSVRSY